MSTIVACNSHNVNSNIHNGSSISANVDISQSTVPPSSTLYYEIQRIAQEAMGWYNWQSNYNLASHIKETVRPDVTAQAQNQMHETLQKVEQRLKEHLTEVSRIESDPLHEIRKRVAQFRLT